MIGRARLPDGPHVVEISATDWVGNTGTIRTNVSVDSRKPRVRRLQVQRTVAAIPRIAAGQPRIAHALVDVRDYGTVRLAITLTRASSRPIRRVTDVAATGPVSISLGVVPPGRYAVALDATDRAGHLTHTRRAIVIGR